MGKERSFSSLDEMQARRTEPQLLPATSRATLRWRKNADHRHHEITPRTAQRAMRLPPLVVARMDLVSCELHKNNPHRPATNINNATAKATITSPGKPSGASLRLGRGCGMLGSIFISLSTTAQAPKSKAPGKSKNAR